MNQWTWMCEQHMPCPRCRGRHTAVVETGDLSLWNCDDCDWCFEYDPETGIASYDAGDTSQPYRPSACDERVAQSKVRWACPWCSSDRLTVNVRTLAQLYQYPEEDNFETEVIGDHDWDGESMMYCEACGVSGHADDFETGLGEEDRRAPEREESR